MSIWKKFRGLNDREITYDANSIRGERTMTMADYMMTAILLAATLAAITFFGPAVAAIFTGLGVASGGAALVSTIAIGTVGLLAASQAPRINNGLAGLKEAYNDRTAQNNIKNQIKEDLIKVQNAEKKAQKGAHKENLTDQTILREIQKLGKSKKFNTETINQLKDLTGKLEFKNFDKLNQKDIEQTFKLIDGIPNELIKETVKNQLKTEIRKFDINTQQDLLERTPTKIKDQFSPMIGSTENYKKEFKEKAANMSKNGQTFEQAFKDELTPDQIDKTLLQVINKEIQENKASYTKEPPVFSSKQHLQNFTFERDGEINKGADIWNTVSSGKTKKRIFNEIVEKLTETKAPSNNLKLEGLEGLDQLRVSGSAKNITSPQNTTGKEAKSNEVLRL